jgi:hypothetical protein
MIKELNLDNILKQRAVIFTLIILAALFLMFLFFIHRLSSLSADLKTAFGSQKSDYNYNGLITLKNTLINLSEKTDILIDEIDLYFNPSRNLLNLANCRAEIKISANSSAAAYNHKEKLIGALAGRLIKSGVNPGGVIISIASEFECDNFYKFSFDRPFITKKFNAAYNIINGENKLISASGSLASEQTSSEINLTAVSNGYLFTSRALPLELFKTRLNSKYFDLNTAEIDLTFKTNKTDLSDYLSFYELSGRALNFSFIYKPFKIFLNADFIFKVNNERLIIEEIIKPAVASTTSFSDNAVLSSRLCGYIDFKSRSLSIEFLSSKFDLSYFSNIFSKFKNFLTHYSPSGHAKIFVKIEGKIENPETYAELNLSNAMLQGDAGYKNINNISGKLNFINSKISFNDIAGSLMSSKVSINGVCDIAQIRDGGDININFSEIPVTEVKEYMIFNESEIEKLISSASEGRLGITLKLSSSGNFKGSGIFSKCKLTLPIKNEVIEISDAGGNFTINDESIEFSDSYGFIGNVPFFFTASFSKKSLKNYFFNVKIHNIDFSEIIAGKSSYEFLNFISRVQAQNKSKLELKISSSDSVRVSNELSLKLSYPDISLYPLPFSVNIESVEGGIEFDYDTATGAFELNNFDFKLRGASKILLLSFLYRSIPVSIAGNLFGDIHLSQKKIITGSFSISEGVVRYFDNKYVELFIKLTDLNAYFTVQNTIINGICKLKLLSGEASLDFKSDFASSSLSSSLSFDAENINLNDIYNQNPRAAKYATGLLDVKFKSAFNAGNKPDGISGTVNMKNGRFLNLSRLEIISKKDIVPNRIYDFNKFNFTFNLDKNKLTINSPVYEGADKEEFLTVLKNIDYGIEL